MSLTYKKRLRELHQDLRDLSSQTSDTTKEIETKDSICIVQRGQITKKTLQIWKQKFPEINNHFKLTDRIESSTTYIVLPDDYTVDKFKKWASDIDWTDHKEILFLRANWMFDFLKSKQFPNPNVYLHKEVSWEGIIRSNQDVINDIQDEKFTFPPKKPKLETTEKAESSSTKLSEELRQSPFGSHDNSSIFIHAPGKGSYACMTSGISTSHSSDGTQGNQNKHVTDILDQLQEIYELEGDEWRANSYKKASTLLQKMHRVVDSDQLKNVRGIGKSIRDKIQEILTTGTLQKLECFKSNDAVTLRTAFSKIWGVGPSTAHQLVNKGYKSIADLRERGQHDLNTQQRIGLNRYEDLLERMPRSEVQEIEYVVLQHLKALDPVVLIRRGKASSGDVDILVYPDDGRETVDVVPALIERMSDCGFLTDHLTMPSDKNEESGRVSYMGICRLNKPNSLHRRIDIKSYPRSCLAFAMLYFTGSDHFNRSMRLYAKNMGYTMNDKGLFPCGRDVSNKKTWKGGKIECYTEREVFDALGLEYKEPGERNCLDTETIVIKQKPESRGDSDDPLWQV